MSANDLFFDTNVVLYLFSGDAGKADRAEELFAEGGNISVQVMNELVAVGRHRLGMSWQELADVATQMRALFSIAPLTLETHDRGMRIAQRLGISIDDAMIVASALLLGCRVLYTEDLQHGQVVEGRLTIRNPFVGC